MKWQELWLKLQQKQVAPCYLLGGEETYLIRQTVAKIEAALEFGELADLNVEKLMADDIDSASLVAACSQAPWLMPRRLVIVWGLNLLSTQSDLPGELPYVIAQLPSSTCLVLCVEGSFNSRHKVVKAVADKGVVMEFPQLKGRELEKWVSELGRELGIHWECGAIAYLLQRTAPGLRQLEMELRKLAAYAGNKAYIGRNEIDLLIPEPRESRVFALTDAVLAKDKERALIVLTELLQQGETPIGLVGLLAHQVRVVGLAKAALEQGIMPSDLAKNLSVHPFVAQKAVGQSRRFSWDELYHVICALAAADLKLKSTSLPAQLVLEEVILSLK